MNKSIIIANSFANCFAFTILAKRLLNKKICKVVNLFCIIFILDIIFRLY